MSYENQTLAVNEYVPALDDDMAAFAAGKGCHEEPGCDREKECCSCERPKPTCCHCFPCYEAKYECKMVCVCKRKCFEPKMKRTKCSNFCKPCRCEPCCCGCGCQNDTQEDCCKGIK